MYIYIHTLDYQFQIRGYHKYVGAQLYVEILFDVTKCPTLHFGGTKSSGNQLTIKDHMFG